MKPDEQTQLTSCAVIENEGEDEQGNEQLLNLLPIKATQSYKDARVNKLLNVDETELVLAILHDFKDVLTDLPARTDIIHHEDTVREAVRKEIQGMIDMDIIEPSESPYASSIVVAKKSDGSNRICIDYRNLNKVTIFDAEPMPDLEEIKTKISQSRFFSKIDLCKGYWQIPMRPTDRDLTSFLTPDGLYKFKVMPFGMSNSPATFNRLMRKVVKDLKHTVCFFG